MDQCSRGQELEGGVLRYPPKPERRPILRHSFETDRDFFRPSPLITSISSTISFKSALVLPHHYNYTATTTTISATITTTTTVNTTAANSFFHHTPDQSPPHVTGHCVLLFLLGFTGRAQMRANAGTNSPVVVVWCREETRWALRAAPKRPIQL